MPYSRDNPPEFLKKLPKGAQSIFIRVFNSVYRTAGGADKENQARIAAWSAVKQKYHKVGDKWVPREKQITEPKEIMALIAEVSGVKTSWFPIELEPSSMVGGVYKRTAMVNFTDSEGVRLEWGQTEGTDGPEWVLVTVWFDDSIFTKNDANKFITTNKAALTSDRFKPKSLEGKIFTKFIRGDDGTLADGVLNAQQHIVMGELLVPWYCDAQGHIPSDIDCEKALYYFMDEYQKGNAHLGYEHQVFDGIGTITDSFIAEETSKVWTPGAPVLGMKCTDKYWQKVLNGEVNGWSIGGKWDLIPIIAPSKSDRGIFQLTNIRPTDLSLVLKGAIRQDFKVVKSADAEAKLDDEKAWTDEARERSAEVRRARAEERRTAGGQASRRERREIAESVKGRISPDNVESRAELTDNETRQLFGPGPAAAADIGSLEEGVLRSLEGTGFDVVKSNFRETTSGPAATILAHAPGERIVYGLDYDPRGGPPAARGYLNLEHAESDMGFGHFKAQIEGTLGVRDPSSSRKSFWLKPRGGRKAMDLSPRKIKEMIARTLLEVLGKKQDELVEVSPDDLADAEATASILNQLIAKVNALTAALAGKQTEEPTTEEGAGNLKGKGKGKGADKPKSQGEEDKSKEGEDKASEGKEGEHKEGEGKDAKLKEGEGKEAEDEEGEGEEGSEGDSESEAPVQSEEGKAIVKYLSGLDERLQRMEKSRGFSMQEVLTAQGGKSGAGDGDSDVVWSTILGCYISKADVAQAKSMELKRRRRAPAKTE